MLHSIFGQLMRLRTSPSGHLFWGAEQPTIHVGGRKCVSGRICHRIDSRRGQTLPQTLRRGDFPISDFRFADYRARNPLENSMEIWRGDFDFRCRFRCQLFSQVSSPIRSRFRFEFVAELRFRFQIIIILNSGAFL